MTVECYVAYRGRLRCCGTHGPSGVEILTDAPVDNRGGGESFSPTDLVATALGSCMLTIMGIVAQRRDVDITGTAAQVVKEMVADPERRIGALSVKITVPKVVFETDRRLLEEAAANCPVNLSLDPRIKRPIEFHWLA